MLLHVRSGLGLLRLVFHRIAFAAIVTFAFAMIAYTLFCAVGYAEWLSLPLTFGTVAVPNGGIWVQSGVAVLSMVLCFFLPTNARIMALENSHRSFHMGMRDVAQAYALAHRSDREGAFTLKGEFDSIRERIAFLRDHPDLAELEPSVLELASQMSHVSQELAEVYSDRNMSRARDFLISRQQEIETFNERIEAAKGMAVEIRKWVNQVEMEEAVAQSQLDRLLDELNDLMPELQQASALPDSNMATELDWDETQNAVMEAVASVTRLEPRAAE